MEGTFTAIPSPVWKEHGVKEDVGRGKSQEETTSIRYTAMKPTIWVNKT